METIEKIREQLPQGAQSEIAKRAKVPNSRVHRVLNGKAEDLRVLGVIADYYAEYKQRRIEVLQRIDLLTQPD